MFTMETVVRLAILVGAVGAESGLERRILLDLDIAQQLQTLKANSVQMQNKMEQFQNENDQLKINVSELQSQNSQLQNQVSRLESSNTASNTGQGSTYVRWGRSICPANGTTLAYSGYMGGGKYTDTGAAVNHICLTADPIWDYYDDTKESLGKIYGVEYEFGYDHYSYDTAEFFGTNLHDDDALCAVCHSARSATMMIPGRARCYPGWTQEYSGYLMSGYPVHTAATEYICVDRRAEAIPGGEDSNNKKNILYLVEGVCGGSLECPPYVQGRELPCVVCTK